MNVDLIFKTFLLGVCLCSIIFFIFGLAKVDWSTDVDAVLKLYRNEIERTKKELNLGNKKIDELEKEISIYRKKLNKN